MFKMIHVFSIFTLILICACSTQSNNQVTKDDIYFQEGIYKEKKWSDTLHFRRASWFQELFLIYDLMFAKLDKNSPFMNWFSASELEMINSCGTAILGLKYSYSSNKISHVQFNRVMETQGFREFLVPDFLYNLRVHPDMEKFNLQKHKVAIFCHPKEIQSIMVSFPGYPPVDIKL